MYKYLGIFLSTRLSFKHSLENMADRAKKGVIGILRLLWSIGDHSPSIFFKLFDCQISPMLTYGAEVWGLDADLMVVERVHLFALKRFLNTSIKTPNTLVYGETGRFPLSITIQVQCIRYWLQLVRMSENRLPAKAYKMLLTLHHVGKKSWASSVCYFLYGHGYGFVWENQGVCNIQQFLRQLKQRLQDCWRQDWHSKLITHEGQPPSEDRFSFYRSFKSSLELSSYLSDISHISARKALIKFRLGTSCLKIHRFRFVANRDARPSLYDCPFCSGVVEDELHFMFKCPAYNDLRIKYIPAKFHRTPSAFHLSILLSSSQSYVLSKCALCIHEAFKVR